jgi:protein TonB
MKNIIHITLLLCLMCCFTKNNIAKDNDSTKIVFIADTTESEIYERADVYPKFPGGFGPLFDFLRKNLKYPDDAKQFKFEGKVIVKFYVDIDGSLRNPIVLKDGVGGGADVETIRLIKAMPKWIPGMKNGKAVKVYYTIPVNFQL